MRTTKHEIVDSGLKSVPASIVDAGVEAESGGTHHSIVSDSDVGDAIAVHLLEILNLKPEVTL